LPPHRAEEARTATNPFAADGHWFKGNLHVHTTNSDGELSPQHTVDLYARYGYDFLAITDHGRVTDTTELDGRGMLLLEGAELGLPAASLGQSYHVVVLGLKDECSLPEGAAAQDALAAIQAQAELVFIAHPYWSSLTLADLLAIEGYDGIEVFNTTCLRGIGRGHSEPHWDALLARGRRVLGTAVDDAHFHYWDAMGGWIMLKAPELSRRAVISAIKTGAFYASSGPEIRNVVIAGDTVHVECSPAVTVALVVAGPGRGWTTDRLGLRKRGELITEAELPLDAAGNWPFRIEVTDAHGNRAWTNPF